MVLLISSRSWKKILNEWILNSTFFIINIKEDDIDFQGKSCDVSFFVSFCCFMNKKKDIIYFQCESTEILTIECELRYFHWCSMSFHLHYCPSSIYLKKCYLTHQSSHGIVVSILACGQERPRFDSRLFHFLLSNNAWIFAWLIMQHWN